MYDFKQVEEEILKFWEAKKIFEKLRKQNKGKKKFRFLDGPITANNPMGVHHAEGRTYKDLFQRFKAMQGYELRYQNGFDAQGLWIEREEEKDLGLKQKEDIEKFGIKNFVEACKKRVKKFSKKQTEQSIRLGQWMDWDNSYFTNTNSNNLHNWHLMKEYHKKGWIYKGKDVVPWCWRCGTASSKHDIATEGYKEVTHTSLFMQFPLKKNPEEYFLIFTTTPWTIPANVAIAVNANITYVKVENEGLKYWLAEKRLSELEGDYKILERKKGKQLEGLEYIMPYASMEKQKNSRHKVVTWDLASEEEGTGIVHIAPGCGAEDFELGKEKKLLTISPLNEAGCYQNGYEEFSGMKYSEANQKVINDLEQRRFLYKAVPYKHRYPHCWRCGSELVFRLVDEWYIKCTEEFRKKLKSENQKVNWYPEYGKIRQKDWFNNMSDWLISRKRYYGLPLPFWECECGWFEVIGSLEELKEKAVKEDVKKIDNLVSIHRPYIDEIRIVCKNCKKPAKRILDVGDAWLDAGITPFSTIGPYLENKKYWDEWYPADLISENMPGQYRGWFNALFWSSVMLSRKVCFKALFGYESVKDEKGEEMHKSKGNAIWFDDAVEKIGADTMRLLFCMQDPTQELKFGYNVAKEPYGYLNILMNLSNLIEKPKTKKYSKPEDKWIMSKLNSVVKIVTEEFENLHPHLATRTLKDFWLTDFSRTYIQLVRERLSQDDEAKYTIHEIYLTLIKLCAPIIPFITEKIWQNLKEKKIVEEESIHLSSWPKFNEKKINLNLEKEFELVLKIIELGLAQRDKIQIGLKWPLSTAKINSPEKISKELEEIIMRQLNIKKIDIKLEKDKPISVELYTKLTPELEAEGYARELARNIQAFRKELGLQKTELVETIVITNENFKEIIEKQTQFISERTNSKKFEIVTTSKETFKNKKEFKIKDKRGWIVIKNDYPSVL